jgi:hypothetical protein
MEISFSSGNYLLIALHQSQCLAFNVVLSANDVGEDSWKSSAIELGGRNLDIELTSVLVLQIKLNVVLLCALSALPATCPRQRSRPSSVQC